MDNPKVFANIQNKQNNSVVMKIVVVDPLSPFGHKDINRVLLSSIVCDCEVVYIGSSSFADIVPQGVSFIPIDSSLFTIGRNSLNNRWRLLKALRMISKIVRRLSPDVIFFMSYETLTFSLLCRSFMTKSKQRRLYLMNHLNVDELSDSSIKRIAFKMIPKCFVHVVYEDFIKDYIEEHYDRRSLTLPHNLNTYKLFYKCDDFKYKSFFEAGNDYIVLAPSGNIFDGDVIGEIINLDKDGYLVKRGLKLFLKSKGLHYESNNLIIADTYLSESEYSFAFENSTYIFLPYDLRYKYRASGVYFDALTFSKPILYSDTLFFRDQEKRFGEIGITIKQSMKDTFDLICPENIEKHKRNITYARQFYSDDNFIKRINKYLLT